ncbi:MAG: AEC family transporter [Alphaproteobacteria bacterium]|nr:AEC family transporter [Alphaproteobacteria bacterium]
MSTVVDLILPIFAVVALGWGATFTTLFDAASARALARFVFFFAIPLMLFERVATTAPVEGGAGALLATFYAATATVFALGALAARFGFARRADEAVLCGFAAAYGNTVMVGIPVVLTVVGDAAAFATFLIISFHSLIFFTLTTVLVETVRGAEAGLRRVPGEVARGVVTNPILMALVLGLVANRAGLALPAVVEGFAELVGEAAVPCALFATGAALRGFRVRGALGLVAVLVTLKGVVHPLIVVTLATQVFALPAPFTAVAVLLATMPVGVNPYLFAARYHAAEAECATAIAVSTPLAIVTVSLALLGLGLAGG